MTKISFLDHHRPNLIDGDYTLTVEQRTTADVALPITQTNTLTFKVAGPQYRFPPEEIATLYPPPDSIGDHALVMPHVTLMRATLPWERSATNDKSDGPPWLAILLLDHDELDQVKLQTVNETALNSGAPQDAKVRVLDASNQFLKERLPQNDVDLGLLCHVRKAAHGGETAVVLGARLPHDADTCHAFLVSVEDCYPRGTFQAHHQSSTGDARLVVLKSWRFTNGDHEQSLLRRLQNLNHTPMTLQSVHAPPDGVDTGGASLFSYYMRDGSRSAAFYRGPLTPGPTADPPQEELDTLPTLRSGDGLIRYRKGLGVFDVTYAAAWELGRLLALSTGSFAQALIRWRHHAKGEALAAQGEADVDHIRFDPHPNQTKQPVPPLITSFLKKLISLEMVPQNYLLPELDALPADSIRFFQIDAHWIRCLVEGALSIGRFLSNDHLHEVELRNEIAKMNDSYPVRGFLLRSDIVGAFPGLVVEGMDSQSAAHTLEIRHKLAPGLLLYASAKPIVRFVLHPAPEELHCGFANKNDRAVRDKNGNDTSTRKTVYLPQAKRVLDIGGMRDALDKPNSTQGAGFLAFQMIQGVGAVTYNLQ